MNREILFRGKRVDNGEWVEGSLCVFDTEMHFIRPIGHSFRFQWEKVIPETVGQFTGMLDKEGSKIFEGSRVIFDKKNHIGMKGIVRYANHGSFVILTNDFMIDRPSQVRFSDIKEIKITGNIHENK